ncbi:hypothetical protein [Alicycliphilus denitrificans]|uniref:hypothetical protein n=1 Tax=Alicycliphilus denitrificans TaxID=179636 RepID=UPI003850DE51
MTPMLKKLLARYMAPAGDEGADTGGAGTADTDEAHLDDDDAYMAQSEEERRRLRGDNATDDPSVDTLAALVAAGAQQPGQGEAPAGAADTDDASGDKGGNGIPRARFNEVNDRRKALETEVEELRAQLAARNGAAAPAPAAPPAAQSFSIQDAEEQYAQLMLDGDTKAAAALRLQINAAIEEAALARFNQASASERAQTQTAATVEQLLGQFPWLESPEGAEALELIEASAAMKMQRGMSKAQAISEATLAIAPRFAPPYGVRQEGGASGDMRTQRANERGAAHSLQQPPLPQAGMGNRATPVRVDTSQLSDDEYMALPEAERKKARGD